MRFKRSRPVPKRQPVTKQRLWIVAGSLAVFLAGGAAWAYQEVTRKPPPVPADDAQIPPPSLEPLSRFFPSHTAVYARLSLNGITAQLLQRGLSGFGLMGIAQEIPLARYVLPGLNAMMGYPLYFDGNGELTLENHAALESDETRRLLAEIMAEAEGDAVLALYAPEHGEMPFHATMAVRLSDPARVREHLAQLRSSFSNAALFDGIRLQGDHLWITSAPRVASGWWNDLQRDTAFKRTMAHLPTDRFATLYVNGPELRRISDAYERYLQGGEEVGEAILGLGGGLIADPATRALLDQLNQEGFAEQHLGTAATFRLGVVQGHTHTDWTPQDPEGLRQRTEAIMRASSALSRQLVGTTNP